MQPARAPLPEPSSAEALAVLTQHARAAGALALAHFRPGAKTTAAIHSKAGGSPVTDADLEADAYLHARLTAAFPAAGWLSEESPDTLARLSRALTLIVDPIDGTRAFLCGDPRWTVCVALARNGRPIAGVVHAPALGETYAASLGGGAFLNGARLAVTREPPAAPRLAGPHFLLEAMRRGGFALVAQPKVPSLAYRMALVAAGVLDAGLASGKAQDWDIAAVDLIVCEAGGRFAALDGTAPLYNKADTGHPMLLAASPVLWEAAAQAAGRAASHSTSEKGIRL